MKINEWDFMVLHNSQISTYEKRMILLIFSRKVRKIRWTNIVIYNYSKNYSNMSLTYN